LVIFLESCGKDDWRAVIECFFCGVSLYPASPPSLAAQRRAPSAAPQNMEDSSVVGLATRLPILHPAEDGGEGEPALGLKTAIFWLAVIAAIIAVLSEVRRVRRAAKDSLGVSFSPQRLAGICCTVRLASRRRYSLIR
jgi:hypothetical protein